MASLRQASVRTTGGGADFTGGLRGDGGKSRRERGEGGRLMFVPADKTEIMNANERERG